MLILLGTFFDQVLFNQLQVYLNKVYSSCVDYDKDKHYICKINSIYIPVQH